MQSSYFERLQFISRIRHDFEYLLDNLNVVKDGKCNPAQNVIANLIDSNSKRVCMIKGRQLGMTTTLSAYAWWLAAFHNAKVLYAAPRMNMMDRVRNFQKFLPEDMALAFSSVMTQGKYDTVKFEGGGFIKMVSNTDYSLVRGLAVDVVIIDEASFVENMEHFWQCVWPCVIDGRVIIASTLSPSRDWASQFITKPGWVSTKLPTSMAHGKEAVEMWRGSLSEEQFNLEFECGIQASKPVSNFQNAASGPTLGDVLHKMNELDDDELVRLSLLACSVLKARYES